MRSAARLNLPIKWVPDRIAEQNFNLEEPPTTASAWVGVMLKHLQTFRQRLSTMPTLTTKDVDQVRPRWYGQGFLSCWALLACSTGQTVIYLGRATPLEFAGGSAPTACWSLLEVQRQLLVQQLLSLCLL